MTVREERATGARGSVHALVTGGAGFIGSHLAELLVRAGHRVTVLDDLSTGRLENLAAIAEHPRVTVCVGSVHDASRLQVLVDDADIVYHLAASVGVRKIMEGPIEAMENNLLGTAAVLKAAARHRTPVLLASSSEVYGKGTGGPSSENDDVVFGPTVKTRWSYAYAKALDEFLGLAYCRDRGVPVTVVRYFNVVGPRQRARYGMVVPRFVRLALEGEPLTVYGDGQQTRSFTDVSDAVAATYALSRHPDAVGQVFNVGSDREVTILTLAHRVKSVTGSASPIVFVPYDEAYGEGYEDVRRRVADISKARSLVGYAPAVTLDETLATIAAATERPAAPRGTRRLPTAWAPHVEAMEAAPAA